MHNCKIISMIYKPNGRKIFLYIYTLLLAIFVPKEILEKKDCDNLTNNLFYLNFPSITFVKLSQLGTKMRRISVPLGYKPHFISTECPNLAVFAAVSQFSRN